MQKQQPMFKPEGKIIKFSNDSLKSGLNYTVRLGADYAQRKGLLCGDYIVLQDTHDNVIATAEITHLLVCRLKDIPNSVLKDEHETECRNPYSLYFSLGNHYPDHEITPDDFMTCVGFVVK